MAAVWQLSMKLGKILNKPTGQRKSDFKIGIISFNLKQHNSELLVANIWPNILNLVYTMITSFLLEKSIGKVLCVWGLVGAWWIRLTMMGLALVRATHTASMRGEQVQIWLVRWLSKLVSGWLSKVGFSRRRRSTHCRLEMSRALVGWSPTEIQLKPKYVLEPLSCKLGHYVRAPYRTPDLTWIIDNLTQAEAREKGRNLFRWLETKVPVRRGSKPK